jgi:hypothetical protein
VIAGRGEHPVELLASYQLTAGHDGVNAAAQEVRFSLHDPNCQPTQP